MKLSLHSVAYGGYFYDGPALSLEETVRRAARFGYDAVEIFAHRHVGFPMDFSPDRRKALEGRAAAAGR
jgi:sugar phosphate isomerase/epimerase